MYRSVIKIDGMMCEMCESHINDVIRKAFKVKKVNANRIKKEAVVLSEEPLTEEAVHQAIDPTGYTVFGFQCEPYQKKGLFGWLKRK